VFVDCATIHYCNNSSSSSSSSSTPEDSVFIVPTFRVDTLADTEDQLKGYDFLNAWQLMPREHEYPSLDPTIITMFHLFRTQQMTSSRLAAVLADMRAVQKDDPFAKFVIFSSYGESLQSCRKLFERENTQEANTNLRPLNSVLVEAKGNLTNKQQSLKQFNEDPNCNICLLSTGVAATGLTLTIAHVCYILEPLHNAADEAQALSRVHRIGQTHSVRCVIFYSKDSSEERMLALRKSAGLLTEMLVDSVDLHGLGESSEDTLLNPLNKAPKSKKAAASKAHKGNVGEKSGSSKNLDTASMFSLKNMQILYGVSEEQMNSPVEEEVALSASANAVPNHPDGYDEEDDSEED